MNTLTILVTGCNGQLGSELQTLASSNLSFQFLFTDRNSLDIANQKSVAVFFATNKIDVCINAAAFTAVDKAESETAKAFLGNETAVANLAKSCFENNALFIHYSTDYVFDGTATTPYLESDNTNALGVYGQSKLAGETAIENLANQFSSKKYFIIRTSWVYSSFGNNFIKTMLRLMKDREEIKVVNDQKGCPTYAFDLAAASLELVKVYFSKPDFNFSTIYNYSNEGECTWYELAKEIATQSGYKGKVTPITTAEYPTPAKRPAYSVFNKSLIKKETGITIPDWKDSLKVCLQKL